MLPDAVAALAAAGGTAMVGAMVTDAWEAARDGCAQLFARAGTDRRAVIEAQLVDDADTVAHMDEAEREQVRQELAPVWRRRLGRLLEEHPDANTDLENLIVEIQKALPPDQGQHMQTQINIARENARVFGVMGGDIHYHEGAASPSRPPGTGDRTAGPPP